MIEQSNRLSELVITRVRRILTVREGRTHWECQNKECWAIVVRISGKAIFVCNGKRLISDAENVLILPKGSSYYFDVAEKWTYTLLEFDAEQCGNDLFSLPIGNSERVLKPLNRLQYNAIIGHPYHAMEQIHGTYEILLSLLTQSHLLYVQKDKARVIEKIVNYIDGHYRDDLTNAALANRCGISEVYFRKLFTQITGISPITYLHKIRTAKAAELLQNKELSLSEIAEAVGYSNLYHFSTMFKRYMGMPPSKYAKLFGEL